MIMGFVVSVMLVNPNMYVCVSTNIHDQVLDQTMALS